jgi:hypothetical protein
MSYKDIIIKALKWALIKFEPKPEELKAWPFPAVSKDFEPRKQSVKVIVPKATTRKTKPAVVAKTAAKKTAKKKIK